MSCFRMARRAALAAALALVLSAPAAAQNASPVGERITLTERTIVYVKGAGKWDSTYETLVDAFRSVQTYMEKQGLKATGPYMTIFTSADDSGFQFQAAVPIADVPKNPPRGDIAIGKSPAGLALRFEHTGAYDQMDDTYEAIANYLDEKQIEPKEIFIEEYASDPVKTPEDKLMVHVIVPLK